MTIESTAISRPRAQLLIPGYHLVEQIGRGGMGEVHKAVQLSLDRTVAVKLLSAELSHDESFVARFEREAAALAALSHPHIVSIVDKGSSGDTYYLVMEYVDGPSLREVMRSPLLEIETALKIVVEICRAIDYAHTRGIIHRDLKPENILFDEQAGGIAKVSDFGLASFMEGDPRSNLTQTHMGMGTLSYMAPEQGTNAKNADHRADIYSLGVIIYELLVGEVPVGNFDPPSRRKPGIDKRLDAIVARCLRPLPQDRYAKVSELLADLEPLAPTTTLTSQIPKKANRLERVKRSIARALRTARLVVEAAVVGMALLVLLVGLIHLRSTEVSATPVSEALTVDTGQKGSLTPQGKIGDSGTNAREVVLGAGPDVLPMVTAGRTARFEGNALLFATAEWPLASFRAPEPKEVIGRILLDLPNVDGAGVKTSADFEVQPAPQSAARRLRARLLSQTHEPRGVLALTGEKPGNYVALALSGAEGPLTLEWSLGERRGTLLGQPSPKQGRARLELAVTAEGVLTAHVGEGKQRKQVGESIGLGPDWRKLFGKIPDTTLACVEGDCQIRDLRHEVPRPPPPQEDPVASGDPSVEPQKPVASVKQVSAPARPATKPAPSAKKPAKAPPPKKAQAPHRKR